MPQPYLWLRETLTLLLPDLENLPAGPEGEARVRLWFERLLARFAERGLSTPAQQKNRVVDVRNAIRTRFGEDHPALAVVGFDEATWQKINLATHDRTEARNAHQRLLRDPEGIVARAAKLLGADSRFEDLAVGLAVAVGRRISELLDAQARLEPVTAWSVRFAGQRKHRGPDRESFAFEIPTLVEAARVLDAWGRLRVMLGDERLDPRRINARYSHAVNRAADAHFRGLVPPRLPPAPRPGAEGRAGDPHGRRRRADALYLHLFRAVYATIAVHWFCPPRVNRVLYKAEIQGHRQIIDAESPAMRRSYAASRHYDDYQIADATGENIDGRQGIKLGRLPGLEVLAVFRDEVTADDRDDLQSSTADGEEAGRAEALDDEHGGHPPDEAADAADDLPPEQTEPSREPPTPPSAEAITMSTSEDPSPTLSATDAESTTTTTTDEPSATAPAGDEGTGKTTPSGTEARGGARATRGKGPTTPPGIYRVHKADRRLLDDFRRRGATPKQNQADNLHGVIALALGHGALTAKIEDLELACQQLGAEREQAWAEAGELRVRLEEKTREAERLLAARSSPASATPAVSTAAVIGLARELLEVAGQAAGQSPLQARLLALASRALAGLQPGGAPTPPGDGRGEENAVPGTPPGEQPGATPSAQEEGEQPPPTHSPAEHTPSLLAEAHGEGQPLTTGATTVSAPEPTTGDPAPRQAREADLLSALRSRHRPSGEPTPSRRGGAADKLARAVEAVMRHNEAQTSHGKKWALTESALARLTGCFRPAVRRFFAEHDGEIEAHNRKHHLTLGHNPARGRRGETIEDEITWRPAAGGRNGAHSI